MKTFIIKSMLAILTSLIIILIFFIVSSLLKTEKPAFVSVCVFSVLTLTFVVFRYPDTRWYLPIIIYLPIILLLIIAYKGEGMKFYFTAILTCILITYLAAFIEVRLFLEGKKGLRKLKTFSIVYVLSILILLAIYLTQRYARLEMPLIAILDTIFKADQDFIRQNKGWDTNSPEWKEWVRTGEKTDSINMLKVQDIIDRYGWPGEDLIGWSGNSTIWTVIQHSTLENQEHYLPIMREAVQMGKARPSQLALLEDRILMRNGKEQIFGTQTTTDSLGIHRFWPIKDERNVNKRRFKANLGPLQWYAKQIGLVYTLPE